MLRVISEIRPTFVVGENVAGIVNMALDTVLSDLEGIGYSTQAFVIPACAVDAPHRRDRCAIVAFNTNSLRCERPTVTEMERQFSADTDRICKDVANSDKQRPQGRDGEKLSERPGERIAGAGGAYVADAQSAELQGEWREARRWWTELGRSGWWPTEPNVGRVAHGVSFRVDRLKCLGNAVVPQQFYPIFKAISDIERQR